MILYFSATGNSKYVAERIARAMDDRAVSIEKQEAEIILAPEEILGLVTPTYLWQLPPIVRDFIGRLEVKGTGYAFGVSTYGTSPGFTREELRRELARRGIQLSASFSVKMPDTWTPTYDLSDREKVGRLNENAETQIDSVIAKIAGREGGYQTERRLPYILKLIASPLFDAERRTKHFHAEESCIGCGLCYKMCPDYCIEVTD